MDGELGPELAKEVGSHLEACARCYPRLLFERAFREALATAAQDATAPESLEARILESLPEE